MPAPNCFAIPPSMSLETAVLIEPLCVGLHTVRLGGVARGMRLLVVGAGPIGLSVLLAAKATAPCTVYVTDLLDQRLAVARQCGADWIGNARGDGAPAALAVAEPAGVDLVFECSGDPACVNDVQRVLAPGGTLMLVGIPAVDQVGFNPHRMRRAELTFKTVRRQNDCVAATIALVSEGRIDPSPMLTHRYPLEEITAAFELVAGYRDGVVKALIDLGNEA
jgi:threonine dehydrogenase-like Zn-dependent dehydrogenase